MPLWWRTIQNHILDCLNENTGIRLRTIILSLYLGFTSGAWSTVSGFGLPSNLECTHLLFRWLLFWPVHLVTSTERASHSWGWASAQLTHGSKHIVIFNGKVVLQIPVSLFDDHIHAKECLRQPLGRDKGLCAQALQAEGIKAEQDCASSSQLLSPLTIVFSLSFTLGLLEEPPWCALSL